MWQSEYCNRTNWLDFCWFVSASLNYFSVFDHHQSLYCGRLLNNKFVTKKIFSSFHYWYWYKMEPMSKKSNLVLSLRSSQTLDRLGGVELIIGRGSTIINGRFVLITPQYIVTGQASRGQAGRTGDSVGPKSLWGNIFDYKQELNISYVYIFFHSITLINSYFKR